MSRTLTITYDKSNEDTPVMCVSESNMFSTTVINVFTGKKAKQLYKELTDKHVAVRMIDGKEPQYELRRTDEEIKLGIDLGDEVVGDYGSKGIVVGIDTYEGEVMLSLLMRNHKVPQLVKASMYKTKTSRKFPQIVEVLEQIRKVNNGHND